MSLEALRKLAGGPKVEAAKAVAGFLHWCSKYQPPTRFTALEIDGVASPEVFAAPESPKGVGAVEVKCRRCDCTTKHSNGLCHHCSFDEPCPKLPTGEQAGPSWVSFLEVDNVDHDAVADGVVMAFFALRGGHGTAS